MPINLATEDATRAAASLERYCSEELDADLGDSPATLLLEFILAEAVRP